MQVRTYKINYMQAITFCNKIPELQKKIKQGLTVCLHFKTSCELGYEYDLEHSTLQASIKSDIKDLAGVIWARRFVHANMPSCISTFPSRDVATGGNGWSGALQFSSGSIL